MTWCVQTKKPIPRGENLFRICTDWSIIILWTITVFSVLTTEYFLQQFEDIDPKWDWHRLTVLGFANATGFAYNTYKIQSNANRIFYACCLFSILIFNTVLSVYYLIFMTNPIYDDQIDSIRMIVADDYTLTGDEFALKYLRERNEVVFSNFC